MADFGVCRVKKLKNRAHVVAALKHNQRAQGYDPGHVDAHGKCWELLDATGVSGTRIDVRETRLDAEAYADRIFGGRTFKRGTIPAGEMVLSASPQYFRPRAPAAAGTYDSARLNAWAKVATKFLSEELGFKNLISVTLQADEATPHIQAIFALKTTWSDQFGNDRGQMNGRRKLSALQDRYGEALAGLGIERGVKRSEARHKDIKVFYGAVNAGLDAVQESVQIRAPRGRVLKPDDVDALLDQQREEDRRAYAPGAAKFTEMMSIDRNAKRALNENVGLRAEVKKLRDEVRDLQDVVAERDAQLIAWRKYSAGFVRVARSALTRVGRADLLQPFTVAVEELLGTLRENVKRKHDERDRGVENRGTEIGGR